MKALPPPPLFPPPQNYQNLENGIIAKNLQNNFFFLKKKKAPQVSAYESFHFGSKVGEGQVGQLGERRAHQRGGL